MNVPANLKYTTEHEWIKVDGKVGTVGITDWAQGELGDVVFVELPEVGAAVSKGDAFGTIEAVKAVSELYSPIDGKVVEAYGVWVEKKNYGRTYMGIERSTFLIGPDKKVIRIWRKVRVKGHAEDVLNVIKSGA